MNRDTSTPALISPAKALKLLLASVGVGGVSYWAGYDFIMVVAVVVGVVAIVLSVGARLAFVGRSVAYLSSVYVELQNCKWPELPDVYKAVVFVLWAIVGLSGYLFVVDLAARDILVRTGVAVAPSSETESNTVDQ